MYAMILVICYSFRCTADLNRLARIDRIIEKEQSLYSVISNREAGYIDVVRNY